MGTGNHRSSYPIPEFIRGFPAYLREAGYYTSNNSKTDYNTSEARRISLESWDESSDTAGWWKRKPGQPFFAVFNFIDSHQSRVMTNPWTIYKSQVLDHLDKEEIIDPEDITMPPFYKDSPPMRKEHSRIYNGLSLTDKKIDTLLSALRSDGLIDSTIIFFYADHGEGMPRGKANSTGLGYRVPWAIWFPDMYKHLSPWGTGTHTRETASFVDLAPTILSLAGIEIPAYMSGRAILGEQRTHADEFLYLSNDRSGEASDIERSLTDGRYMYTRVYKPFLPEHRWQKYFDYADICKIMVNDYSAGILDPVQKRTFQKRSAEYLYDLEKDPWEIHNLAGEQAYENQLVKFRKALNDNLSEIRDIHFLPEYHLDSISSSITPWEYRLKEDRYSFEDIFAAASLSGMGSKVLKQQLELLKHPNGDVRYWAGVGLRSQSIDLGKYRNQIIDALGDEYPPAKIIISGICHNDFHESMARDYLEETCRNENPHLALMALQTIMYLDEENSRSYLPMIHELYAGLENKKGFEGVRDACEMLLYVLEGKELSYELFW